jgi:hypothetical protein
MSPFDVINSITYSKKRLIDDSNEKQYNAFQVNKGLSYFIDTVFLAQEMNMNYHLDPLLQHDYLFNATRKQKRYAEWVKKKKDDDIEAVKTYFNYGYQKANEAYSLLNKEQIKYIKEKVKGNALVR